MKEEIQPEVTATAMQQMVMQLQNAIKIIDSRGEFNNEAQIRKEAYKNTLDVAIKLLEVERKGIIDARLSVTGLNHASPTNDTNLEEAEAYYNTKYNNQ